MDNLPANKKIRAPKHSRWIGGLLIAAILFIAGGAVYLSQRWKPIATNRIKQAVLLATDSLYTLSFEDISINVLTGNISFKNMALKADTVVYNRLKKHGLAPAHTYDIELTGLVVHHANPLKVYFRQRLEIKYVSVDNPRVKVFYDEALQRPDSLEDKRTVYQRISKMLRSLSIDKVILRHIDYAYIGRSQKKPLITGVKDLSVTITDLLLDSVSQYDKNRFYYTKDVFAELKDYAYATEDGMYTASLRGLSLSTAGKYIRFKDVSLSPNYPAMQFSRMYPERHDRYDMHFDEIMLQKIDFEALNARRKLIADRLLVGGGDVRVFINSALPRLELDKGPNFPQLALQRSKLNIQLNKVELNNADLTYTEFNPASGMNGSVFFKALTGSFRNITNDSVNLVKNKWCRGHISALLMGQGQTDVNLNFDLTDNKAAFTCDGTVGKMNLRALNPASRALAMVQIASGMLNELSFNAKGNLRGIAGHLNMNYSDFRISILKKDSANAPLKKQRIVSLIANMILIKSSNPEPGSALRVGKFSYARPKWSSFFNLLWNGIFTGLKPTVGLSEEMQRKLKEQSADSFHKKREREKKQEERKRKRLEREEKRAKNELKNKSLSQKARNIDAPNFISGH